MNEREAFESWFKEKSPVGGVNAKLAARDAWLARAAVEADRAQRVPDVEDLKDRLVAISSAVADSDDREAQAIIRTTLELLASTPTPAPAQQETTHDELDFHSDAAINGQQRGLACTMAMGQQVGRSRRQGRSDPETEKAFRLAVTAVAKPIAIAVAQNCNSVPQLTFPHIYLGLADLFSEHQEQPQQERKPMTDVEIEGMYWEANRWLCTDLEDYKKAVRDTERHHGIRKD